MLRACLLAILLSACAGHAERTKTARDALSRGQPSRALELYNEELEVDSEKQLPEEVSGDNALLLLDRSLVLQELTQYDLSSRDLETADKQVEMLDFSRSTADEIGRYVFSDDTGPYKAPPYEKLMINTMNMVNYLARGDLQGARVEARRLAVMQKYLSESESEAAALLGAGSYLAGFVFEKSSEPQTALRYYDEALQYGDFRTLYPPIVTLSKQATYRTPRLEKVLSSTAGGAADAGPPSDADNPSANAAAPADDGEVLIVVSYGRVPAKIAKRVPIGLALTYASGAISPTDRAQANTLAAQGLVTWVNFPTLEKPRRGYDRPSVSVNEDSPALDLVSVDEHVIDAWKEGEGAVIASAITRMITRVIAGQAASKATDNKGLGLLLSLATQATLTATDTPDTRSWATLPARMAMGRLRVPAGKHTLQLSARGQTVKKTIEVKPGGWAAVNLTVLR